jgi:DNA-binding transcriptional LysR family regulator
MDLTRLHVFYVLAKSGSFTNAAKILHVSQSAVSRSIQLFEHRIKAQLINRSKKGVTLTPQGEILFEFSKRFIDEYELILKISRDNEDEPQGPLKIITTPYLASTFLPTHLAGFFKKYPKIVPTIVGEIEDINLSQADIAIRTYMPHHPQLIQKPFFSFHNELWAHPTYIQKHGMPKTAEDLDNHQLIIYGEKTSPAYGSVEWILSVGAHTKKRKPYLTTNSTDGVINLALQGLGIIQAPKEYVELKSNNLVQILPEIDGPVVDTYLIYPKELDKSQKVQAFADYVKKNIYNRNSGNS